MLWIATLFSLRPFPWDPARLNLTPNLLSPPKHINSDWVQVCPGYPTAVSYHFSLPDHSIRDIELIDQTGTVFVKSAKDFLKNIWRQNTWILWDEKTRWNLIYWHRAIDIYLYVTSLSKFLSIVFLHQSYFIFIFVLHFIYSNRLFYSRLAFLAPDKD